LAATQTLFAPDFFKGDAAEIVLFKNLINMKKHLLTALILLAAFIAAKAQQPDTARVIIHYKFNHVRDTTAREHPYMEKMVLYVGKNASVYKSYDRISANAQFKKAYAEAVASSPDGHPRVNRMGVGSPVEYYQFPNEQKLLTKDQLMMNSYLVETALPAIAWKISSDTATYGSLHCQKAIGNFKGREYTAWFCPDLPVHTGPWKLNGLPGVIVDAHDAKNEVVFKFVGVEKAAPAALNAGPADADLPPILRGLNDDNNLIASPAGAIKATPKEFDKLRAAMEKDPNAFAQAIMANNRAGDGPKMDAIKIKAGPGRSGPVINNPIELPERK
jgi:GLPGLI family protein